MVAGRRRGRPGPWAREAADFTRAFSGAFLFGIPLLFTMEMWWLGTYAATWKLLVFLALAFVANLGLTTIAGFKHARGFGWATVNQAVDAVAVGVVASTVVLLVLNRIGPSEPLDSILGKVIIQAIPLSIGASLANAIFGRQGGRAGEEGGPTRGEPVHATLNDLGATAAGSLLVSFSIAPTEEIPMLASGLDYPHLIALIALTLVLAYAIVFESEFDPEQPGQGAFQHPLTETVLAYVVSLLVALLALFLFHQIEVGEPLPTLVAQTLVLGLPASIGGAAGRLAV